MFRMCVCVNINTSFTVRHQLFLPVTKVNPSFHSSMVWFKGKSEPETMVFTYKFSGFDCKSFLQQQYIIVDKLFNILILAGCSPHIIPYTSFASTNSSSCDGVAAPSSEVKNAQLKANCADNRHTSQTQLRFFWGHAVQRKTHLIGCNQLTLYTFNHV